MMHVLVLPCHVLVSFILPLLLCLLDALANLFVDLVLRICIC